MRKVNIVFGLFIIILVGCSNSIGDLKVKEGALKDTFIDVAISNKGDSHQFFASIVSDDELANEYYLKDFLVVGNNIDKINYDNSKIYINKLSFEDFSSMYSNNFKNNIDFFSEKDSKIKFHDIDKILHEFYENNNFYNVTFYFDFHASNNNEVIDIKSMQLDNLRFEFEQLQYTYVEGDYLYDNQCLSTDTVYGIYHGSPLIVADGLDLNAHFSIDNLSDDLEIDVEAFNDKITVSLFDDANKVIKKSEFLKYQERDESYVLDFYITSDDVASISQNSEQIANFGTTFFINTTCEGKPLKLLMQYSRVSHLDLWSIYYETIK